MMISQYQDEDKTLQRFVDTCKKLFGNNLKAIVLFGSCASGEAKNILIMISWLLPKISLQTGGSAIP
jgi:predicted nucleotidyltransferase